MAPRPPQMHTLGGSEGSRHHPPLTSEFMGMAGCVPAISHELPDDEGESDGFSIGDVAPRHRPSQECAMADAPGQPLVVAESLQTYTPLDPHVDALACT